MQAGGGGKGSPCNMLRAHRPCSVSLLLFFRFFGSFDKVKWGIPCISIAGYFEEVESSPCVALLCIASSTTVVL